MILKIKRRLSPDSEPYWQNFSYESQSSADTVATALNWLNEQPALQDPLGMQLSAEKMRRLRHGDQRKTRSCLRRQTCGV